MKPLKILVLFTGMFFQAGHVYSQHIVEVTAQAQEVIVYLSGAELRLQQSIALKKGVNVIHFKGMSPFLLQESVQISAGQNVEMLSVSTGLEQISPDKAYPKLKALNDSIAVLEDEIVLLTNKIDAFEVEKRTLEQNQRLGGSQTGVALTDLTRAADFFRERTLKINNNLSTLTKSLKKLNSKLSEKRGEINNETKSININRGVIKINANSAIDQHVDFSIRYLIQNTAWEASYDIVAKEINSPVSLKYKGLVYNHSGIDWKDVKISLSTGDISLNASRPNLTAWVLNYSSQANEGLLNFRSQNVVFNNADSIITEERVVSELNATFTIDQRHSIPADGLPYSITLANETLPASFEYLTVPKMELSAFLIAKVTGWEKLNLIDGVANVYFGNTYIGESNINTRVIGDTLELSFGRDNQIVVSRTKIEDKGNTPTIGGKRTESFTYEIQLRNNRKVPIAIKVQDQIPVSQEKDITVDVSEVSGASLDAASGRLQWLRTIPPGDNGRMKIAFTVRYPKNQAVNIRKSRVVQTPRYRN